MRTDIKTILYHGTIFDIDKVDVSYGQKRRDFGKGFYMAVSKKQAEGMMHKKYREASQRGGLTSSLHENLYIIELDENVLQSLSVKIFASADAEWVDFILACRWGRSRPQDYDLIIGPTADDDTNLCLSYYMDGVYGKVGSLAAKNTLIRMMEVENLGIQYCITKQPVADTLIKSIKKIEWR